MRIFNPDGSEVGACGNASRAVGLLLGPERAGHTRIETGGGLIEAMPPMPASPWTWAPPVRLERHPARLCDGHLAMPLGWETLENPVAVNVGNPHAVFFVPDVHAVDLARLGPIIENDPVFPERVNVNVASVIGPDHLALRVGTRRRADPRLRHRRLRHGRGGDAPQAGGAQRGGGPARRQLAHRLARSGTITMTGPATTSFEGAFDDALYPL
jgi:diaminopimelate epimerase